MLAERDSKIGKNFSIVFEKNCEKETELILNGVNGETKTFVNKNKGLNIMIIKNINSRKFLLYNLYLL